MSSTAPLLSPPPAPAPPPPSDGDIIFFRFPQEAIGAAVTVNVFAILSTLALLSIAIRITYLGIVKLSSSRSVVQSREYTFFSTQLGSYAGCLLVSNALSSIAGLIGLVSLIRGGIEQDGLCTTQAALMQFANVSAAYYTVAIAVHTFLSLVLRRRQVRIIVTLALLFGWILAAAISTLPLYLRGPVGPIYGVSAGITCGVRDEYPEHKFLLHLLPIFTSATLSALFYALIFLTLRGYIEVRGGVKLHMHTKDRDELLLADSYHQFVLGIAKSMLWFPIVYIMFLMPYAVTRVLSLRAFTVPLELMVFAFVCWFMLGVANVLVLYNTFRVLGPAFDMADSTYQSSWRRHTENRSLSHVDRTSLYPTLTMTDSRAPSQNARPISVSSYYEKQWEHQYIESSRSSSNLGASDHYRSNSASTSMTSLSTSKPFSVGLPTVPRASQPASLPRKTSTSYLPPPGVPALVRTSPGQTMSPIAESTQTIGVLSSSNTSDTADLDREINGWLRNKGALQYMRSTSVSSVGSTPSTRSAKMREPLGAHKAVGGSRLASSPRSNENYF